MPEKTVCIELNADESAVLADAIARHMFTLIGQPPGAARERDIAALGSIIERLYPQVVTRAEEAERLWKAGLN